MRKKLVLAGLFFCTSVFSYATTFRVPSETYPTIQAGMNAASPGDTVLVANGTYTGDGNLFLNFNGKAIVVKSENGPENCVIDCVDGTGIKAFMITNGETRGSVVNGFKIINGCWVIYVENSSPTITGNILVDNNSGVYCGVNSNPLVENNTISNSNEDGIYCYRSNGTIQGNSITSSSKTNSAGISLVRSSPTIKNNVLDYNNWGILCGTDCNSLIESNSISNSYSYGIYCSQSSPLIRENKIEKNVKAGIYCKQSSPEISRNLIYQNGGINFSDIERGTSDNHNRPFEIFVGGTNVGGISINDNSNPKIQNNIIAINKGVIVGAVFSDDSAVPTIINNHIVDNSSIFGGSLYIKNASAKIINNIVAGSKSSDTYQGVSRWYKDDLFARFIYEGAKIKNVTYYFGFINNGPPGEVQITGCTGLNVSVWAETGERFWVEARSHVSTYGEGGGLTASVAVDGSGFNLEYRRPDSYSPWITHGCDVILSPEIISHGISQEGMAGSGIVVPGPSEVPQIAFNNVFGNCGGNYALENVPETKNIPAFDLTGTEGNISSDPNIDPATHELLNGSPCIDTGTPDIAGLGLGDTDYTGNLRIFDGDGDGIAIIDIGAFEFQGSSFYIDENVAICQGESYEGWTESGDYQRTLSAANGNDSIVTTHLTVYPAFKPGFTVAGDTLISDALYTSYQWCDSSGEIAGENGRQCIIKISGEYYLLATNEHDCTYASDTLYVEISTVNIVNASETGYTVIPNPNNGNFLFRIHSNPPERLTIQLINSFGQVLETRLIDNPAASQSVHFNGYHLNKGVYHLVVITENEIMSHKIIIY